MKPNGKNSGQPARRRDLFTDLAEGMTALAEARQGKRTLRTHAVAFRPAPEVSPAALIRVRRHLHLSRALFATCLRTTRAPSRTGSRAAPSPMPRPPC